MRRVLTSVAILQQSAMQIEIVYASNCRHQSCALDDYRRFVKLVDRLASSNDDSKIDDDDERRRHSSFVALLSICAALERARARARALRVC